MRSFLFLAAVAVICGVAVASGPRAADKCDPGAVAKKYPSLAGKTIRVAQDPQGGPPYTRPRRAAQTLVFRTGLGTVPTL